MSDEKTHNRSPRAFSTDLNDSSASRLDIAFAKMLRDLPIFTGLNVEELDMVSGLFRKQLIQANQVLFDREDPGDEAYVIVRGSIYVHLQNGKPLGTFQAGHILGELAFLDGEARGATAKATSPTILLVIMRNEFEELTETCPNIGRIVYKNIARELTTRLRRMNSALESSVESWETAMFRRTD
jgi:CRP/FNR family transcriptional regulator, cyclic AMP receptor protein